MGLRNRNLKFDRTDLQNRIVLKAGSLKNFAEQMDISVSTLIKKLASDRLFREDEIYVVAYALDIPKTQIGKYFFCLEGERKPSKYEIELNTPIEEYGILDEEDLYYDDDIE